VDLRQRRLASAGWIEGWRPAPDKPDYHVLSCGSGQQDAAPPTKGLPGVRAVYTSKETKVTEVMDFGATEPASSAMHDREGIIVGPERWLLI